MPNDQELDPTSEEVLIETERYCIAMQQFLRLSPQMQYAVRRQVRAAAVFLGEDRVGEEASLAVFETAQKLAEGLRAHPTRKPTKNA